MFSKNRKYHFIGIGGIGMCGLAEYLLHNGQSVSGSDLNPSENTDRLIKLGAAIMFGHRRENVGDCDVLIYSSAVREDNPELAVAEERNIPTMKRAELLGQIFATKSIRIAISGTHGKTTTTSMVGQVMTVAGKDPLIISGGVLKTTGSPVRLGHGDMAIAEADEFDRSFLQLVPTHAIVTTIEEEHLDIYNDLEEIKAAFCNFAQKVPERGWVIACSDEKEIPAFLEKLERPYITYGINGGAFQARNIHLTGKAGDFKIYREADYLGKIHLNVPGLHNVKNALAAVATATLLDIPFSAIQAGLADFQGVRRRFEIVQENPTQMLVDDYAHHPSEITATLSAARKGWQRRIVAVFQPHLYSRTKDFFKDFATSLLAADVIVLLDIYAARELPLDGVTSQLIYDEILKTRKSDVYYVSNKEEALMTLNKIRQAGDMIITLGAGDINKILPKLMDN